MGSGGEAASSGGGVVGGLEPQGSCVQLQHADRAFLWSVTESEYFCAVNVIAYLLRRRRHAALAQNSDRRRHMSLDCVFYQPEEARLVRRFAPWDGQRGQLVWVSVRMTDRQTDRQTDIHGNLGPPAFYAIIML